MAESATLEAPAAAAPAAAADTTTITTGPREFSPSRAKFTSMREALEAHGNPDPNRAKPAEKSAAKPEPKLGEKPEEAAKPEVSAKPEAGKKTEEAAKPADVPRGTKPGEQQRKPGFNPVKELKTAQSRVVELEGKIKDYESNRVPDQERTTLTQRMETLQKENERLSNRIRFKDYESSPEFQKTYHQPYVSAVDSAMRDLKSVPVMDAASGQQRAATHRDLFEVVNLLQANDLPSARARAKELFGEEDARDVMEMAKKVRDVGNARMEALETEERNGAQRVQQTTEQYQRQAQAIQKENDDLWKQANETVINNPQDPELQEFLKPKVAAEGKSLTPEETKHNERLERGFNLAHTTFAQIDTLRKKLFSSTKEERADAAMKLAVVTGRCAGFGVVREWGRGWKARAEAAEKKLQGYEQSEPPRGGRKTAVSKPNNGGNFREGLRKSLQEHARR